MNTKQANTKQIQNSPFHFVHSFVDSLTVDQKNALNLSLTTHASELFESNEYSLFISYIAQQLEIDLTHMTRDEIAEFSQDIMSIFSDILTQAISTLTDSELQHELLTLLKFGGALPKHTSLPALQQVVTLSLDAMISELNSSLHT